MRVDASPFDSEQYGLAIGRAVAEPFDGVAQLESALTQARSDFDVVFVRVPEAGVLDRELRHRGDVPADVLVTSTLTETSPAAPAQSLRYSIEAHDRVTRNQDLTAIEAISASVLRRSHLHADRRLPAERTQRYYAAWARNNATGRAHQTFLARADGQVIGYLSMLLRTPEVTTGASTTNAQTRIAIDLIATSAEWQGQGIGSALLAKLAEVIANHPGAVATVGTQADNPALKLYRRCGYTPTERHATYHVWLRPKAP